MVFGFDHIDEDDPRYAEVDADALRDLRDEQRAEAEVLERHLAGGLAGDVELEERAAVLAGYRKSSPDLGSSEGRE